MFSKFFSLAHHSTKSNNVCAPPIFVYLDKKKTEILKTG
jgi:hypothetical protein